MSDQAVQSALSPQELDEFTSKLVIGAQDRLTTRKSRLIFTNSALSIKWMWPTTRMSPWT